MTEYDLVHSFLDNLASPRFRSMANAKLSTLEHMEYMCEGVLELPSPWCLDALAADMDRKCPAITEEMGIRRTSSTRRKTYFPRRTSVSALKATGSNGDDTDCLADDDNEHLEDGHIQGFSCCRQQVGFGTGPMIP